MTAAAHIVARRYARAYYELFGKSVAEIVIEKMQAFAQFLTEHHKALAYTKLGSIPVEIKISALITAAERYHCARETEPLIKLLAHHKRLYLLGITLEALVERYRSAKKIIDVVVTTAQPLTPDQELIVQQFIARSTNATTVHLKVVIDRALLAGIRLEGATLRWECSVQKQLQILARPYKG